MINDARALWKTASGVVQNIAMNVLTDDDNEDEFADVSKERDAYKQLLEDTQMSLVELSKASRVAIAEKEAELRLYKDSANGVSIDTKTFDNAKLMAETTVLRDSLQEVEMNMVRLMQQKNEIEVKCEMYEETRSQLAILKAEFSSQINNNKDKEENRSETIENLVEEYSKLASEYEVFQMQSDARLMEVTNENEVLATKMHVLELSLSELVDRESLKAPGGADPDVQLNLMLKESRSKVVNLQYDLKERNEEIERLKKELNVSSAGPDKKLIAQVDSNALLEMTEKLKKSEEEVLRLVGAMDQLVVERGVLKESGRRLEEEKQALVEVLKAKEALENSPNSPFRQTLQAEVQKVKNELIDKSTECMAEREKCLETRTTLDVAKKELITVATQLKNKEEELYGVISSSEVRIRELESGLIEKTEAAMALASRLRELESERDALVGSLTEKSASLELASGERKEQTDTQETELHVLREKISLLTDELAATASARDVAMEQGADKDSAAVAHAEELVLLREELESSRSRLLELTIALNTLEEQGKAELSAITACHVAELAELRARMEAAHSAAVIALESAHKDALLVGLSALRVELEGLAVQREGVLREELLQGYELQRAEALEQQRLALETDLADAIGRLTASKDSERLAAVEGLKGEHVMEIAALRSEVEAEAERVLTSHAEEVRLLVEDRNAVQTKLTEVQANLELLVSAAVTAEGARKEEEKAVAVESVRVKLQGQVDSMVVERDEYFELYSREREQRKLVHNKLIELQGNIRVFCRARPVLEVERRAGAGNEVDVTEFHSDDVLSIQKDAQTRTRFEFDRVFAQVSSQEEVFAAVQPLCVSVLDGFNVCIFAYGQTGSGKTFTMEGYGPNKGVAPRAVDELFKNVMAAGESGNYEYTVVFSMLEIYNETIRDLLDSGGAAGKEKDRLDVRQSAEGVNIVQGLIEETVESAARVAELMAVGQSNRAVGSHDMNEHSSRSHSILTLTCRGRNLRDNSTTFGKLHLIDLAGSERLSKTDASGDRLKEAQNINRSLSALGDVISALGNKKATHIPYRNSKLTFLLQDSLGGNSKVLMFVNISPAVYNVSETLCSLNFASRCRSVELGQARRQVGTEDPAAKKKPEAGTPVVASTPGSGTSSTFSPPSRVTGRSSMGPGATLTKRL